MPITSKERVLAAINHQVTDRVPLDYVAVSEVTKRLIHELGTGDHEGLMKRLHIDMRPIEPRGMYMKVKDYEDGSYKDIFGIRRKINVSGNTRFNEVIEYPLAHVENIRQLDDYQWPAADIVDYSKIGAQIDRYSEYATFCGPWTPIICQLFDMRGMEQVMMDLVLEPVLIKTIINKLVQFYFSVAQKIFEAGKGKIDIYFTGDDYASQNNLIISKEMFREFFKPGLYKLISLAKDYGLKVMMHSCGAITELIPEFIEMEVDILDPIQVEAKGMDIKSLKRNFGDRLCFHGAIDQQYLLPFGCEAQVREKVRETIRILGKNGGYILCSSHSLLDNISTENIVAMYDEVLGG